MAKLIVLDAGHGGDPKKGGDVGAVNGKKYEKDYTLAIAKKVANKLKALGYEVIMTRETDKYVSLQDRCKIANTNKCDVFVSIHLNSAVNKNAHGIETFMWKSKDKTLATNIQNSLVILFPNERNRGVKSAAYYVLKNTTMQAALVECGFLSHDATAKKFDSYYYQNRLAEAITNGILRTVV